MRIALFTDTFPPEVNGVANTVVRSAAALARAGHKVAVFTVSAHSSEEMEKEHGNVFKVIALPSVRIPIYLGIRGTAPVGLALAAVKRFGPDVIHTHTPFSVGIESLWASRMFRIPLVGTHHTFFNHYLQHVHLDYKWAERLSWKLTVGYYNRCDLVISPTRSLADELLANGLKRPYEVLPNAIDTDAFSPAGSETRTTLKAAFGLAGKTIVYMGRLSYEKSVDQAIHAFALTAKKYPDAQFLIIGDGPDRASLEQLSAELGLSARVRFTGFTFGEELVGMLQASDVFLTASKSENMPLAILEAMACGLPVVAVKSLGLSEIIEDGANGFLLPPDASPGLAEHCMKLLEDAELRARFAAASRKLSEQHSEPAITKRLADIYARAIRGRSL